MKLDRLYEMQEKLDKYILQNNYKRTGKSISRQELFSKTILALLVEVGELANTTRCFKHWSTKGMMEKEVILEEISDAYHFYASIGNQLNIKMDNDDLNYAKTKIDIKNSSMVDMLNVLCSFIIRVRDEIMSQGEYEIMRKAYIGAGQTLYSIPMKLGFTDEEVEQAYLKKHKENYRRQREGY